MQKGQRLDMNKEYITPDFDIVFFDIQSIITVSEAGWEEDEFAATKAFYE
ncbi:MAG: hypothetical protein ACI4SX_00630 [Candidatus Fimenecus sp.]